MNEDYEAGDIAPLIITPTGLYFSCEIVEITCPACGELFKGTKRDAGGFIAGHQAYHEFTNAQDMLITSLGGV
jgi:hypothetical protein